MAFFKTADPNIQNQIVEVMDNNPTCEKCNNKLNLLNSINGKVMCGKCGHENKILEMN